MDEQPEVFLDVLFNVFGLLKEFIDMLFAFLCSIKELIAFSLISHVISLLFSDESYEIPDSGDSHESSSFILKASLDSLWIISRVFAGLIPYVLRTPCLSITSDGSKPNFHTGSK